MIYVSGLIKTKILETLKTILSINYVYYAISNLMESNFETDMKENKQMSTKIKRNLRNFCLEVEKLCEKNELKWDIF